MSTTASNARWALGASATITAGGFWLFEYHLEIPMWDSSFWWLYPFFFTILVGGLFRQFNEDALIEGQLDKMDGDKPPDRVARRRPLS